MTKSSLREQFERLGHIQGVDPIPSGSPAIVSLRLLGRLEETKSVEAVIALRRRGAPTLKAKRAVEAALERKTNVLDVPTVESLRALAEDLRRFGFAMSTESSTNARGRNMKEPGLDGRHRDKDGEIHKKRSDTLVGTLRKEYGPDFAKGYRSDARLGTVLSKEGAASLRELLDAAVNGDDVRRLARRRRSMTE
jgi:hypothetical protein